MFHAGVKRSFGWVRQPFDPRDRYHFALPKKAGAIPSSDSLESGMGKLLNQGNLGSCGPNTLAECIAFDRKLQGLADPDISRLFAYYVTRFLMGTTNQDSGVDNRTMLKAANQFGNCLESQYPYADDPQTFTKKPPQGAYTAALPNVVTDYAAVIQNLDQMRGVIHSTRRPFIFGFNVFNQIESEQAATTGVLTDPGPGDTPIGGHDVTFLAFDDNGFGKIKGGAFKFRNHWANGDGTPWGDNGCGYISYKYATSPDASDFWVINAVPGGSPTPGPGPGPGPGPTPAGPTLADAIAVSKAAIEANAAHYPHGWTRHIAVSSEPAVAAALTKLWGGSQGMPLSFGPAGASLSPEDILAIIAKDGPAAVQIIKDLLALVGK